MWYFKYVMRPTIYKPQTYATVYIITKSIETDTIVVIFQFSVVWCWLFWGISPIHIFQFLFSRILFLLNISFNFSFSNANLFSSFFNRGTFEFIPSDVLFLFITCVILSCERPLFAFEIGMCEARRIFCSRFFLSKYPFLFGTHNILYLLFIVNLILVASFQHIAYYERVAKTEFISFAKLQQNVVNF